jgi:hypothetical protein
MGRAELGAVFELANENAAEAGLSTCFKLEW